jgi:hypothetical protein
MAQRYIPLSVEMLMTIFFLIVQLMTIIVQRVLLFFFLKKKIMKLYKIYFNSIHHNTHSPHHHSFYNVVLLTKVRDDIAEHKRLNYHLYLAVKKSLFKPSAFFKGFLLPLCEVISNLSSIKKKKKKKENTSL